MRLVLRERKKTLKEQNSSSTITVSMHPSSFLKLTTDSETFSIINSFVLQGKQKEAINLTTTAERKKFILNRKTLPKEMSNSQRTAINLLIGGLNFIAPTEDNTGLGQFDESKSSIMALGLHVMDGKAKVTSHEGRNRNLYYWMSGNEENNIVLTFDVPNINTTSKLPEILISQFDNTLKVFKENIKPQKQSGSVFKNVEGFVNKLGKFPNRSEIENLTNKNIKVNSQEAALLKTKALNPPGSEYSFSGTFHYGLYPKDQLPNKVDFKSELEYLRQLEKIEFKPEAGPVIIES